MIIWLGQLWKGKQLFFYALLHQWKQVLKFVQRWLFKISNGFGNFRHVTDFGESLVYLFSTLRYLITLSVSAFYWWISLIYIANVMDWVALEGSEHRSGLAIDWSIWVLTRPVVNTGFNRSIVVDWWSIGRLIWPWSVEDTYRISSIIIPMI